MGFGALSVGHCRSQVDPVEHVTEQEPVQLMWQVEFPVQDALPL